MSIAARKLYTAADLASPEFNDRHVELINGEIIEMSPTQDLHGITVARLLRVLAFEIESRRRGGGPNVLIFSAEAGFYLHRDPDTVVAPDIALVRAEDVKVDPAKPKFLTIPPAIAIEVLSPSNTTAEILEKVSLYIQAGTEQVWVVDPKRKKVFVESSTAPGTRAHQPGDRIIGGGVLTGIDINVSEIFD